MRALLDLVLPALCAGCGAPGEVFCRRCQASLWPEPQRIVPRVDPGVPCWATGDYGGGLRRAILAGKDHGRRELAPSFGRVYAGALTWMRTFGELDPAELAPLVLIPAPSSARAARRRGGDPVLRAASHAGLRTGAPVHRALAQRGRVADSSGLSARSRLRNLQGSIEAVAVPGAQGANVVLLDDVLTTGTTVSESVAALAAVGVQVTAALVLARA